MKQCTIARNWQLVVIAAENNISRLGLLRTLTRLEGLNII